MWTPFHNKICIDFNICYITLFNAWNFFSKAFPCVPGPIIRRQHLLCMQILSFTWHFNLKESQTARRWDLFLGEVLLVEIGFTGLAQWFSTGVSLKKNGSFWKTIFSALHICVHSTLAWRIVSTCNSFTPWLKKTFSARCLS